MKCKLTICNLQVFTKESKKLVFVFSWEKVKTDHIYFQSYSYNLKPDTENVFVMFAVSLKGLHNSLQLPFSWLLISIEKN